MRWGLVRSFFSISTSFRNDLTSLSSSIFSCLHFCISILNIFESLSFSFKHTFETEDVVGDVGVGGNSSVVGDLDGRGSNIVVDDEKVGVVGG